MPKLTNKILNTDDKQILNAILQNLREVAWQRDFLGCRILPEVRVLFRMGRSKEGSLKYGISLEPCLTYKWRISSFTLSPILKIYLFNTPLKKHIWEKLTLERFRVGGTQNFSTPSRDSPFLTNKLPSSFGHVTGIFLAWSSKIYFGQFFFLYFRASKVNWHIFTWQTVPTVYENHVTTSLHPLVSVNLCHTNTRNRLSLITLTMETCQ